MFTLQTSFKPLLLRGGEVVKSVSRGDCQWQGGILLRLCPNYVQEFAFVHPLAESILPIQVFIHETSYVVHQRFAAT
jgi:hypothetical protein